MAPPASLNTASDSDLKFKLKWLMLSRMLFTSLLLGSTIALQLSQAVSPMVPALLVLYGLILGIFILSFIYSVALRYVDRILRFAYIQIGIDTLTVSLLVFVTGNYSSIFSFLYLVVIIYSCMLLYRKGSIAMAAMCSFQYGSLLLLEYQGFLVPFAMDNGAEGLALGLAQVLLKILITTFGCFAVAFLSSLLAEQTRQTKKELWAMEDHVKRVDKLAAIGEMAAGLAHEIKNPLASLTGSIQILKNGVDLDADHARLMHIVLREADRLSALVNNFLLFARPPAGKVEPIELDKAIQETVELFERDSTCQGRISIKQDFSQQLFIEMDPDHFRQVLWNLLLNAAEAINGDGTIDIKMHAPKGPQVRIDFTDSGCGISDEALKSIFDPFYTTKPNGTGLGLSIVYSILETYDSRLDVKSKEGIGTTFTLNLNQSPQLS
jgi:two-component system sensor histidine kinase PilS (NtrC family)